MSALAAFIKRIPGAKSLYRGLRARIRRSQLQRKTSEQVFSDIFRSNGWGSTESASGRGSTLEQTRVLIERLPGLFRDIGAKSVLDVPCGDFNWMSRVNLVGLDYTGADIVPELVDRNRAIHHREGIRFVCLDLIRDELPKADVIFCRDCLVHLSHQDIFKALQGIARSGSGYLLTTTFPARAGNGDIVTGDWRPLNLQAAPFCFPQPIVLINEECPEGNGAYKDKSMALWRLADLHACLPT